VWNLFHATLLESRILKWLLNFLKIYIPYAWPLNMKVPLSFETSTFIIQLLSETFLILGRIHRDTTINVHRFSCKVPVIIVGF
jgi:hypothetical protein